ncbi:MAG: hypothetical protein Q9218_000261 [Villophora microphyllina]
MPLYARPPDPPLLEPPTDHPVEKEEEIANEEESNDSAAGGSSGSPSDETAATSEPPGDAPTDETHPDEKPNAEPDGGDDWPHADEGTPEPNEPADEVSGDPVEAEQPGEPAESPPPTDGDSSGDAHVELKEAEFPPIEPGESDESHGADPPVPVSLPLKALVVSITQSLQEEPPVSEDSGAPQTEAVEAPMAEQLAAEESVPDASNAHETPPADGKSAKKFKKSSKTKDKEAKSKAKAIEKEKAAEKAGEKEKSKAKEKEKGKEKEKEKSNTKKKKSKGKTDVVTTTPEEPAQSPDELAKPEELITESKEEISTEAQVESTPEEPTIQQDDGPAAKTPTETTEPAPNEPAPEPLIESGEAAPVPAATGQDSDPPETSTNHQEPLPEDETKPTESSDPLTESIGTTNETEESPQVPKEEVPEAATSEVQSQDDAAPVIDSNKAEPEDIETHASKAEPEEVEAATSKADPEQTVKEELSLPTECTEAPPASDGTTVEEPIPATIVDEVAASVDETVEAPGETTAIDNAITTSEVLVDEKGSAATEPPTSQDIIADPQSETVTAQEENAPQPPDIEKSTEKTPLPKSTENEVTKQPNEEAAQEHPTNETRQTVSAHATSDENVVPDLVAEIAPVEGAPDEAPNPAVEALPIDEALKPKAIEETVVETAVKEIVIVEEAPNLEIATPAQVEEVAPSSMDKAIESPTDEAPRLEVIEVIEEIPAEPVVEAAQHPEPTEPAPVEENVAISPDTAIEPPADDVPKSEAVEEIPVKEVAEEIPSLEPTEPKPINTTVTETPGDAVADDLAPVPEAPPSPVSEKHRRRKVGGWERPRRYSKTSTAGSDMSGSIGKKSSPSDKAPSASTEAKEKRHSSRRTFGLDFGGQKVVDQGKSDRPKISRSSTSRRSQSHREPEPATRPRLFDRVKTEADGKVQYHVSDSKSERPSRRRGDESFRREHRSDRHRDGERHRERDREREREKEREKEEGRARELEREKRREEEKAGMAGARLTFPQSHSATEFAMVNLLPSSRLAIAEIVFYFPALLFTILLIVRHGLKKELGWFFVGTLAVIRIVGASMELAANAQNNNTLFIVAAILNGIGLNALLLAMAGLLRRVNKVILATEANENRATGKIEHDPLRAKFARTFKMVHFPLIVAVVLTAIGSSQIYDRNTGNDAGGRSLAQAGIIIFLVVFLALILVTAYTFGGYSKLPVGERRILYAVVLSIPFIAVRLIYSLLVYYDQNNSLFELRRGNIWVRSFMAVFEEWVTVLLYLSAGLLAPVLVGDWSKSP